MDRTGEIPVRGFVYDVRTGRLSEVFPMGVTPDQPAGPGDADDDTGRLNHACASAHLRGR